MAKLFPRSPFNVILLFCSTFFVCSIFLPRVVQANLPPRFLPDGDMNQHTLTENTPIGTVIYTLKGEDPEGSPVKYGIKGTDKLAVNEITGEVTVVKDIDREARNDFSHEEIRLIVTIVDEVKAGRTPNLVEIPISVIILDQNDNKPVFRGTPYKATINEDTAVGTTIFQAIEVTDVDLIGEILDVRCVPREGYASDACDHFEIAARTRETDHDMFRGSVVLKKPLNFQERQIYRLPLAVFDGKKEHTVYDEITFNVMDVQNSPPVFSGSFTGIVNEDDPIGTTVLTVNAKDGDSGNPRKVIYELVENPNNYFLIDPNSGEIRIDRNLDRESLIATSGVLTLKVKALELVDGIPGSDETTTSVAAVTITIRDINDEPPKFNKREYEVIIPENVPYGTPLANLNMEIKDTDTGPNSEFQIELLDDTGKFSVEPTEASGHTAVSLKVNSKNLDYENPNERKFLLLLVARETNTEKKLSSTATVTVQVQDLNDNSPRFDKDSYTAIVSENSPQGTEVVTITARDRDSGDYGTQGIRYKLSGQGAGLFSVDPISGKISVAAQCDTDELEQTYCLDFETTKAYFLSYTATDNNGEGKKTVVNVRITIADANDNPPIFDNDNYVANINEGESKFQPKLFVKARDADQSSVLKYSILEGNTNKMFTIDRLSGEITVRGRRPLNLDNIGTNMIRLKVQVTDGQPDGHLAITFIKISVKDVNDRAPVFDKPTYLTSVPENAVDGTVIETARATDADYGVNAELTYRISRGAYDDFAIDPSSGEITLSRSLDYDRRDSYSIEIIAVDGGTPSLTGTATLTVSVMDKNVKHPYFLPSTQRAQITEDMQVGTVFIRLQATDPDVKDISKLVYKIVDPITAVNKDGKPVLEQGSDTSRFKSFFGVDENTGDVYVAEELDRSSAASVTLTVQVTDLSAGTPQHGKGTLIVTIVDVNDYPPVFQFPWTEDNPYITINVNEEQSIGSVVHTFIATDADSNIEKFRIKPKNEFFNVESDTGNLVIKSRIDYEALDERKLEMFGLIVYDGGVPQKSATATVIANIRNMNDETPKFEEDSYAATIVENAEPYTPIVTVFATDKDDGEFGEVKYSLGGTYKNAFEIGSKDGVITVIDPSVLDREETDHITLQAVASDYAPFGAVKSSTVPINITILDVNDNQPVFVQHDFFATIVDNIPYYPDPSPIVQVTAVDADEGIHSRLFYSIIAGNSQQQFTIDSSSGIIYPNTSFFGQTGQEYTLSVEVNDESLENTRWENKDRATIRITIENVNTHKPEWVPDPPPNEAVEIMEEENDPNTVVLDVDATDRDGGGENGRISYFIKQNNLNVGETNEFSIDQTTGEVRAKIKFDREKISKYELVLVARDHGTPISFETLRFVTVVIKDINDNLPMFPASLTDVRFTVPEEEKPGYKVGRVEASDADEGKNGRVHYYIVAGNEGNWFSIDKSYGNIYTKKRLDREERDRYSLQIKTSNDPYKECENGVCNIGPSANTEEDSSVVLVQIFVEDKNDNLPNFESSEYYVGIPYDGKVGDLILDVKVNDPDIKGNGKLTYAIIRSELFPSGSTISAGSLVKDPSPFAMTQNGRLVLGSLMAEFNQDKFVLDIEAVESRSNHRAKAKVNVWIYEPEQLIKLVIARPPMKVHKNKTMITAELKNVTQQIVVVDEIRYHIDKKVGLKRDMTDMYVHVVDEGTNTIVEPEEVLKKVDANVDHLSLYYEEVGIKKIILAEESTEEESEFDANLAALIALLLVLFLGVVMFSLMCCCVKSWVFAASATNKPQKLKQEPSPRLDVRAMSALGGAGIYNSPTSLLEEGPISGGMGGGGVSGGTDNPLWIDQKYKAYEEQELTMTVFSDQDNSVISGNGAGNGSQSHAPGGMMNGSRHGSVSRASHLETQSNAYATINKLPMVAGSSRRSLFNGSLGFTDHGHPGEIIPPPERDYATLEKSIRSPPGPIVPGIHSTPIHQQQGSLPRRYSNDFNGPSRVISPSNQGGRSNLIINQNGEPELVADLL